jgi:DNA-binding GntR family transcriptional regulator
MQLLRNHSLPSLALRELEHRIATGRLRSGSWLAEASLAAGLDISCEEAWSAGRETAASSCAR